MQPRADQSTPHGPLRDEALCDAVQEMERLRQSEARALRENAALLGALSAMTASDGPASALGTLLVSARDSLGADAAVILRRRAGEAACEVAHATEAALTGQSLIVPEGVMDGPRYIADLAGADWFADRPAYGRFRGLVAAPILVSGRAEGAAALLCLSERPAAFGPACLRLLGRIAGLAGAALDKLALAERQALLAAVIEGSSASIAIADARRADTPLVYVNPAFEALTGYGRDAVLARNCRLLAADPPDAPERVRLRAAVAERRRGEFLLRNRRRDGTLFWNELTLDTVPDEGAAARYLVATQTDASERIAAREALQRINDRLALIAAVSDAWFWEFDAELRWVFLSEPVERVVGLRPRDIIGTRLEDLTGAPEYEGRGDWEGLMRAILSLEPIQGFTFRTPAAAPRDAVVQVTGRPVFGADGRFAGYRGVAADVTEIVRAKEEAEVASRAKSEFLATVSHELRTPLTAILGNAELLAPMLAGSEAGELLGEIDRAGRRLEAVLGDVIDLARLDSGRLALVPAGFAPADLLDKVAALHRAAAAEKGLSLVCEGQGALADARLGDAARLLQILHHLIGNAVKFTREGGVRVSVEAGDPERLVLRVSDSGVGIAQEHQTRVFESFVQLDARVGRTYGGNGLGLAICRQLVRLMAGEIALRSTPGVGTTVEVSVPVPLVQAPAPAAAAPEVALAGLRMLIADDTAANRRILTLMLERMGAECLAVADGAAALAAWREARFDVGLFDINMPGLDGVALIRAIRAAEVGGAQRLPALAVTANAMPHQVEAYRAAGFDGCVGKPFGRERLLDAIWELVAAGDTAGQAARPA